MPGLEDCTLSGLKSALTMSTGASTLTDRHAALWMQSRGGTDVLNMKTFSIDGLYAGPEGPAGSTFQAPNMPAALPLKQQQWQTDSSLTKQQNLLGMMACAHWEW